MNALHHQITKKTSHQLFHSKLLLTSTTTKTTTNYLKLHDVTPRDGLQNEKVKLTIQQRYLLIKEIIKIHPTSIEVASFVRGDVVPAMSGATELIQILSNDEEIRRSKIKFAALVPNLKGFETLHAINEKNPIINTVVVLTSCTESHSKANVNRSLKDALQATLQIITNAKKLNPMYQVRAYASLAFACPFEGKVSEDVVVDICQQYMNAGADEIILADTLGVGYAHQVTSLVNKINAFCPLQQIGLHLHDSARRAHLLVEEGLRLGIRDFDAAIGGTGGCNFAPGSAGNISIEKLLRVCKQQHHVLFPVINEKQLQIVNHSLQHILGRKLEQ
jgi:hydroxymethylglutaryl-CoA lyase